jgi:broad specificity phosphatase PhoE
MTRLIIPHKPFYFIRHGETDWNKEYRAMGHTDIPLNQNGLEQAVLAAELLKDIQFDCIISSPLRRALKTAQIIAEKRDTAVQIVDEFKECFFGVLEGTNLLFDPRVQGWEKGARVEDVEHYHDFFQSRDSSACVCIIRFKNSFDCESWWGISHYSKCSWLTASWSQKLCSGIS